MQPIDRDYLESLLVVWGRVMRKARPPREDRSLTGISPLAHYGRPAGYRPLAEHRSGRARREMLGAAAGVRVVPMAYVDPIPCTATRTQRAPDFDARITSEVEQLEREWLALWRVDEKQAEVLRQHYQLPGDYRDKARDLKLSATAYKARLREGKAFLLARINP